MTAGQKIDFAERAMLEKRWVMVGDEPRMIRSFEYTKFTNMPLQIHVSFYRHEPPHGPRLGLSPDMCVSLCRDVPPDWEPKYASKVLEKSSGELLDKARDRNLPVAIFLDGRLDPVIFNPSSEMFKNPSGAPCFAMPIEGIDYDGPVEASNLPAEAPVEPIDVWLAKNAPIGAMLRVSCGDEQFLGAVLEVRFGIECPTLEILTEDGRCVLFTLSRIKTVERFRKVEELRLMAQWG